MVGGDEDVLQCTGVIGDVGGRFDDAASEWRD